VLRGRRSLEILLARPPRKPSQNFSSSQSKETDTRPETKHLNWHPHESGQQ
jgi:hypothetical protein